MSHPRLLVWWGTRWVQLPCDLCFAHSRVRHFLSFLRISRIPESRRVRIKTRLLLAPSRPMNQLAQLHLRLLPRWNTRGKATTMDSSAGKVSFFALEFSTNKAFLLHSSHTKIHRHFILRSRIFYWYFYTIPNIKIFQYTLFNSFPVPASMVRSSGFHCFFVVQAKLSLSPPNFGAMW